MLSPLLIETIIRAALEEDLGPQMQDITSQLTIPAHQQSTATMNARQDGTLSGLIAGLSAFSILDPALEITLHAADGDTISTGQKLATIQGNARAILSAERTALNIIGHMSGIATATQKYVNAVKGTGTTICDTRKTLPGLRALQKYAVTCGGGANHRIGLYDAIMIKDNHIAAAGSITQALTNACLLKSHMMSLEIEVDTLEQLEEVLAHGGAQCILLDNMAPQTLTQGVEKVKSAAPHIKTEASGGVSLETVRAIAETGVDYISVGALTHSVSQLDIGLDEA